MRQNKLPAGFQHLECIGYWVPPVRGENNERQRVCGSLQQFLQTDKYTMLINYINKEETVYC